MGYESILFERSRAVGTLTLNRPDKLNALTTAVIGDIRQVVRDIARDDKIRVLLITGKGRGFCAGQDLDEDRRTFEGAPAQVGQSLEDNYNPMLRALRRLEKPVIAAVNGVAAGAGCNLALNCDFVIAARSASFLQAFSNIGLVPDAGGTYILPRLVGPARATGMFMLGQPVAAEQAAAWGMIWSCVDDDQLMPEATGLARTLARRPTKALGYIKRLMNATAVNDLDRQLSLEHEFQLLAGRTADYREGVAAFLEKRKPRFRGR